MQHVFIPHIFALLGKLWSAGYNKSVAGSASWWRAQLSAVDGDPTEVPGAAMLALLEARGRAFINALSRKAGEEDNEQAVTDMLAKLKKQQHEPRSRAGIYALAFEDTRPQGKTKIYVGMTNNLQRRKGEHLEGIKSQLNIDSQEVYRQTRDPRSGHVFHYLRTSFVVLFEEKVETRKRAAWSQRNKLFVIEAWATVAVGAELNTALGPHRHGYDDGDDQKHDPEKYLADGDDLRIKCEVKTSLSASGKDQYFVQFLGYRVSLPDHLVVGGPLVLGDVVQVTYEAATFKIFKGDGEDTFVISLMAGYVARERFGDAELADDDVQEDYELATAAIDPSRVLPKARIAKDFVINGAPVRVGRVRFAKPGNKGGFHVRVPGANMEIIVQGINKESSLEFKDGDRYWLRITPACILVPSGRFLEARLHLLDGRSPTLAKVKYSQPLATYQINLMRAVGILPDDDDNMQPMYRRSALGAGSSATGASRSATGASSSATGPSSSATGASSSATGPSGSAAGASSSSATTD